MHLPGLDGPGPPAVAADNGRGPQLAGGDHLADAAADAAGLDADHLALFDVFGDRVMGGAQAGRSDGQFVKAQLLDGGLHDLVDDEVAVPEVVVEGEGHAASGTELPHGLCDGADDLGLPGLLVPAGTGGCLPDVPAVHIVPALIDLPAVFEQEIGNISADCVDHTRSPFQRPQARASFSVCSAPGINAMSIILPSTVNTPTPAALCSR